MGGEGCSKMSYFGSPSDGKPLFCTAHKRQGDVDVKNPRCRHPGCSKQPNFGSPEDSEVGR